MKILHVAQLLGVGGLEKIIYHLARQQQQNGHNVAVYIYGVQRDWVDFFRQSGIKVITPPIQHPGYDLQLLKRLLKDTASYDIIHTHDLNPLMYLGPINLWRRITLRSNPKLIHTTHGLDHLENYPHAKLYEKIVAHFADKVIGVSKNVCDFYRNQVKLPSPKIKQVDNGVEVYSTPITISLRNTHKAQLCQELSLSPKIPIAITIARIVPLKDQAFLIQEIAKRNDLQLLIVGPSGDDKYFAKLKTLENNFIHLTGARSDINHLLLGSDLFLSASTHEGIPVAVLEAMGVEVPCLISNIPGHTIINTLAPNSTLTYKQGDRDDFQLQLNKIITDTKLQQTLRQNGKQAVENFFSVTAMNNCYEKIYQETLC